MKEDNPILSLCIPTNGVAAWVLPAVESIYSQGIDDSLFEVVITDNGKDSDLSEAIAKRQYTNLHYYRTESKGFLNQIDAFEKSSGVFCKMLNHRSKMLPGSIEKLISLVRRYQEEKPIIYCAEGHTKSKDTVIECDSLDGFVREMSYFVSWSAGVGVWQSDLTGIRARAIDPMFPHTVFLFELREKNCYVIWNEKYEEMANDTGKGGYNLFYTFGVSFLDLLNSLRIESRLIDRTFIEIKKDLFGFLKSLYLNEVILPTRHTFIIKRVRESINVYYGRFDYYLMVFSALMKLPYHSLSQWYRSLKRCLKKLGE